MLKFETTTKFDRDMKRIVKRGLDVSLMDTVIQTLIEEKPLDPKHKDHPLKGNYIGFRECHILPDWLLIYTIDHNRLILTASRTGTHSDLF
jgi:mRNA interferase YafQ